MGEPVVLQQSPGIGEQLLGGVANFVAAKRKAQMEKAAAQYQQQRDQTADNQWNKTYQLSANRDQREGQKAQDEHALAPGAQQKQADEHGAAVVKQLLDTLKYTTEQQLAPLKKRAAELANTKAGSDVVHGRDLHEQARLDLKIKAIEAQYAAQTKQLEVAFKQAQIGHEQAGTAHENAETYRAYHPAAAKGSAADRATDEAEKIEQQFDPTARSFAGMLFNTNNPATRGQAMEAVSQSSLTPRQKALMQRYIDSRDQTTSSAFVTPQQQFTRGRDETRDAAAADRTSNAQLERTYHDVTTSPRFVNLDPRLKSKVQSAMVGHGMTLTQTMDALNSSNLPDSDKQALAQALGAQ